MFSSDNVPIGIIAGWGQYPMRVAEELHLQGRSIVIAGIQDHADPGLKQFTEHFRWFGIGKLGGFRKWFQRRGVKQVAMAGKIFKDRILFQNQRWFSHAPDWECIRTFFPHFVLRSKDTRDDTLLTAVVQSFERGGMEIVAGTDIAPELLIGEGCLTKNRPGYALQRDMEFGWMIAKRMGDLDIGQSVTIRDQTVLCVEAIEGTDACIERTQQLCPRGGFTMVKVAKPHQDMRFDLPTIGLGTIQHLQRSGGKALLVEAQKTIFLDRDAVVSFADQHGITIVAKRDSTQLKDVA